MARCLLQHFGTEMMTDVFVPSVLVIVTNN